MHGLRWIGVLAAALVLAACAGTPRRTGAPPADLSQATFWEARGRLGVSGAGNGGSGSFAWEQHGERSDVRIRGPVGIGSLRLLVSGSTTASTLRVETGDGQVYRAEAAWSELEARLGATVPAGKLRYWMLGLPAPGEHRWLSDRDGDFPTLEQDGWRIEYRYSDEFGARLPRQIRAASGETRVRIVIDRWSFDR
jgi:outer membrane lipoprotein LolB